MRGRHQEEAGPGRAGRGQYQRELSAVVAIVRGQLLQHYTGPMPPAGDVPDEAEEVGGLGEDGEVEEDEALLQAASHRTQVPSAPLITATTGDKIVR